MSFMTDFFSLLSGFRKFVIMLLIIIVSIIFRVTNLISGAEWVDLLKDTVIAFMSFNGVEHLTGTITEWVRSKASEQINETKSN